MPHKAVEWLYTAGVRQTKTDDSPIDHGSCVASKAVGFKNGVSKNSKLVIVKSSRTIADNHWAFAAAYDHIVRNRRQGRAVILYARCSEEKYRFDSILPPYWSGIKDLMIELFAQNVHIVACAGNEGQRSPTIDTVPAIWKRVMPLIVVSAVTLRGGVAKFSQSNSIWGRPNIWAPGVGVQCAGGSSPSRMQTVNGTSAAAGMVRFHYVIIKELY